MTRFALVSKKVAMNLLLLALGTFVVVYFGWKFAFGPPAADKGPDTTPEPGHNIPTHYNFIDNKLPIYEFNVEWIVAAFITPIQKELIQRWVDISGIKATDHALFVGLAEKLIRKGHNWFLKEPPEGEVANKFLDDDLQKAAGLRTIATGFHEMIGNELYFPQEEDSVSIREPLRAFTRLLEEYLDRRHVAPEQIYGKRRIETKPDPITIVKDMLGEGVVEFREVADILRGDGYTQAQIDRAWAVRYDEDPQPRQLDFDEDYLDLTGEPVLHAEPLINLVDSAHEEAVAIRLSGYGIQGDWGWDVEEDEVKEALAMDLRMLGGPPTLPAMELDEATTGTIMATDVTYWRLPGEWRVGNKRDDWERVKKYCVTRFQQEFVDTGVITAADLRLPFFKRRETVRTKILDYWRGFDKTGSEVLLHEDILRPGVWHGSEV